MVTSQTLWDLADAIAHRLEFIDLARLHHVLERPVIGLTCFPAFRDALPDHPEAERALAWIGALQRRAIGPGVSAC